MKTYKEENAMDETEMPELVEFFKNCYIGSLQMEKSHNSSKMPNNNSDRSDKKIFRED